MPSTGSYDAVVIGSGPNGLSAAIAMAREGLSVLIIEGHERPGGGTRTHELTEPGFVHDICSSVHPTGKGSPFFSKLGLEEYGLEWIDPEIPLAHPFEDGRAFIMPRNLSESESVLGEDTTSYLKLMTPLVNNWNDLVHDIFAPIRIPGHPFKMAQFGIHAIRSANGLNQRFSRPETRAYFSGLAAHSILPLDKAITASFGLVLGTTLHAIGWPVAGGGSEQIARSLVRIFKHLGGEIITLSKVQSLKEIPDARAILFDTTPSQFAAIAGNKLSPSEQKRLNTFDYGPGVFKMDFALSEPVPWKNSSCSKAGTIHLGGSSEHIASGERAVWSGEYPEKPYMIVTQASLFDPSRAPSGKHTLWAYCHVPNASDRDLSEKMISDIEKYAPGFRDTIINFHSTTAMDYQTYNPNYVGGDINGGAQYLKQLLFRPMIQWDPYRLPLKGMYLCSSSTPPGGGVHGMCGFHAARSALKREFGIRIPADGSPGQAL